MVQIPQAPLHTFIPVMVNDHQSLFLVDTGATVTAVSASLARELDLPAAKLSDTPHARTNVEGPIRLVDIQSLSIGHHVFSDFQAVVLPMQHLESFLGRRIDGVIGMNLLSEHRFGIDPSMVLFSIPHPGLSVEPVDIAYHSNALWVELPIQGVEVPFKMKIDTGSDVTTLGTADFQRLAGCGLPVRKGKVDRQLDVNRVRQGVATREILVTSKLGGVERKEFPIRLGHDNLLGMDFFQGRILAVDPVDGACWIGPEMTQTDTTAKDASAPGH